MDEVRRPDDGELCGFVDRGAGPVEGWRALTVFGVTLGHHPQREDATRQVLDEGLASLAERWILRRAATGEEDVVCILEANPVQVTVALGYYAMAGVPRLTIPVGELVAGEWEIHR